MDIKRYLVAIIFLIQVSLPTSVFAGLIEDVMGLYDIPISRLNMNLTRQCDSLTVAETKKAEESPEEEEEPDCD